MIELIKKLRNFVSRERGLVLLAALSVLAFLGMASKVLTSTRPSTVLKLRFAHSHSTRLLDVTLGGSGKVLVPVDMAVFGYLSSQKRPIGAVFWAASAVTGLHLIDKVMYA